MTDIMDTPHSPQPAADTAVSEIVKHGTDMSFMADVIESSQTTPVIVDFWAPWCGPCRQLMPALERAVTAQKGQVKLVKINIDENPGVAGQLGVKSIPAVFGFKEGQPVDGFMGGQPESELNKFVARLIGDTDGAEEAQALVARAKDSLSAGDIGGAAQDFARALQLDPENAESYAGLARTYLQGGSPEEAANLISGVPDGLKDHPEIVSIQSQLTLTAQPAEPDETQILQQAVDAAPNDLDARLELAKALAAQSRNAEAVDHLLHCVAQNRAHDDKPTRKFLLTIFEAEGAESDIAIEGRRRLSSILFA